MDLPLAVLRNGNTPFEISEENTLMNQILISLFSDSKSSDSGYWGDSISGGHKTGSQLWTLEKAPRNKETLIQAAILAKDALLWLVKEGLIQAVEVDTHYRGERLEFDVRISTKDQRSTIFQGLSREF